MVQMGAIGMRTGDCCSQVPPKFLLRVYDDSHRSFQCRRSISLPATAGMVTTNSLGPELSANRMGSVRTLTTKKRAPELCLPMVTRWQANSSAKRLASARNMANSESASLGYLSRLIVVAGTYTRPMSNPSGAAAARAGKVRFGIVRPVLDAKWLGLGRMIRTADRIRRIAADVRSEARANPASATFQ